MIAGKALLVCATVNADAITRRLVIEAAYLHDIGVCRVDAPEIGATAANPTSVTAYLVGRYLRLKAYRYRLCFANGISASD